MDLLICSKMMSQILFKFDHVTGQIISAVYKNYLIMFDVLQVALGNITYSLCLE